MQLRPISLDEYGAVMYAAFKHEEPAAMAVYSEAAILAVIRRWQFTGIFAEDGATLAGALFFDQFDELHLLIFPAWRGRWQLQRTLSAFFSNEFLTRSQITARISPTNPLIARMLRHFGFIELQTHESFIQYRLTIAEWYGRMAMSRRRAA